MSIKTLDGKRFAEMIITGANNLSANAKMVDALNVFPVPDGDTGTNMNLSMTSGAKEVKNNVSQHIGKVGLSLAKGLLMGARGNSGVILSQLFRGFSKSIEYNEVITSKEFAQALLIGVETAYKAVMKPVEGTILTVAKDSANRALEVAETQEDLIVLLEETVKEAKRSLRRTPELLPVLKEVGVVDSGGQGLLLVYEGLLANLKGEQLPDTPHTMPTMTELVSAEHHKNIHSHMRTEDIEYGYCTEFMVKLDHQLIKNSFDEDKFRQEMSQFGDSLLVISDDELVKVHIHAEYPGKVLSFGQRFGSLINMKIENMRQQHSSLVDELNTQLQAKPDATKTKTEKYGVVAVAMGSGIAELFSSIGAQAVIEGGQTMNPSTEDIVKAIEQVKAEHIIILPNNGNIIMAAQQAASVVEQNVSVIPSKTVPQGMAALLAFNPSIEVIENEENMKAAIQYVKTGQITYAVRDTNIDGIDIAKDDFMGIADGKIVVTDCNKVSASMKLMESMVNDDIEIITVIYGEDVKSEELSDLLTYLEEKYEDIEVEAHNGKQPLYSFIFSLE